VRVAALYDVHGNTPALEATLVEVGPERVDAIVFGGDFVPGPFPRETLELVLGLGDRARFIRGNGERELLEIHEGRREARPGGLNDAWVGAQLTDEHRAFLRALPETVVLEVDGLGHVLFCHGSPRSDEEILTAATTEGRLREAVGDVSEPVVVCGHTHMQFDRTVERVRVVNAGSVGMPYGGDAGAHWALLGPEVELRQTPYDVEAAAARIRTSAYPLAGEFAEENVLTRPSAEEARELFERMAEKDG